MQRALFYQRLKYNFLCRLDQTLTFKMDIFINVIDTILQVILWYFMAQIISHDTLGYENVGYLAFIFVGTMASFFITEVTIALSDSFNRDMSAGLLKLAYLANIGIVEYFLINFFTSIVFSIFLYIAPLLGTYAIISSIANDTTTLYINGLTILTLAISAIIFVMGNLGFNLMSMGATLYFKHGDPISFILEQLNTFFSGQIFPLSVLPRFLLFVPKIFPTAYIVILWREALFLNKTILDSSVLHLSLVAVFINIFIFALGYIFFHRGVSRAKLEGRWF